MVMALAQDGGGFPFFANSIYEYICGKDVKDIDVDIESVPDADAYFLLTEVETECLSCLLIHTIPICLDAED